MRVCPHIRPHISKTHTAKKCKIKGQAVHLSLQANYSTFFNEEESTHDTLVLPFQLTSAGAFQQLHTHLILQEVISCPSRKIWN